MAREGREERTPRPGRGTPVADLSFALGRAYSEYCTFKAGGMSAEDLAAEKASLVRRGNALITAINAL